MLTEKMINTIAYIHDCIANKETDLVSQQIYAIENDAVEIGEFLLEQDEILQNKRGVLYMELLSWFVEVCSYVENEMDIPAIISDELYDKLVEKMINLGGVQPIGSPTSNIIDITERSHKFPELRGSLSKVHFIWDKEVPKNDTRKSLERYLKNVAKQMQAAGMKRMDLGICVDIKYDGVSHIIEGRGRNFLHVLTRGNVATNMGQDLTPLFKRFFPDGKNGIDQYIMSVNMNMDDITPFTYIPDKVDFGLKVETWMPTNMFEQFKKEFDVKRCNRRSAVTSICNQSVDDNKSQMEYAKLAEYLNMAHFQLASTEPLFLGYDEDDDINSYRWEYIGFFNGHHNYIFTGQCNVISLDDENIDGSIEHLAMLIAQERQSASKYEIPCDGVVITILDREVIKLLGRKDDKNMFQVAFKFAAGEEKTTVEGVDFQVGPVAGRITPVVRLKPIVINGNTISNVTASNQAKLERLNLHKGDEVIIRYDIIPSIFKTIDCKESGEPVIAFPTECPICGGVVKDEICTNSECPSKLIGHILTFVDRIDIKGGIGVEKVVRLVDAGFLSSIGDLYRLYRHKKELYELPRMGQRSIDMILDGISAARRLHPHQILGSIGIPGIGLKTMEKVCKKIDVLGNLDRLSDMLTEMCSIPSIGEKTANMILSGIERKMSVIEDICANIDVLSYGKEKAYKTTVYLTQVSDDEFEEFLESIGVKVEDSFTKSTGFLIIPDIPVEKPSAKIPKAEKWGMPILKLEEAKRKWGYHG